MNSFGTVYLFTKRCLLRRFERSDVFNVFNAYTSDENIFKYLNENVHKNIYETEFMINEFINNYNNLNYYNWLITDRNNYNVIGSVSLHSLDIYNEHAEIGIVISKNYQNLGYAKEVINEILNFAFLKIGLKRVSAKIMIENDASNNLFKSLDFIFEGILHSYIKKNNHFYDINLYYLINI